MARESKYGHERYAKVARKMWDDATFRSWSKPTANAQTLWAYLLTCPSAGSIPGVFRFSLADTAERFGWTIDDTSKSLAEIIDSGRAEYDATARLIYLPNAIKWNEPASANVVVSWRRQWSELPESVLRVRAQRALSRYVGSLGAAFQKAIDGCFSVRLGKASPKDRGRRTPTIPDSEEQKSRRTEEQPSAGAGARPDRSRRAKAPGLSETHWLVRGLADDGLLAGLDHAAIALALVEAAKRYGRSEDDLEKATVYGLSRLGTAYQKGGGIAEPGAYFTEVVTRLLEPGGMESHAAGRAGKAAVKANALDPDGAADRQAAAEKLIAGGRA